nr:sphingolipid c9-methyltransferase 2 [Quercus suber]
MESAPLRSVVAQHSAQMSAPHCWDELMMCFVFARTSSLAMGAFFCRLNTGFGARTAADLDTVPQHQECPQSRRWSGVSLPSPCEQLSALALVPAYLAYKVGGGILTWIFFAILTAIPILAAFWTIFSTFSPRLNEKARYSGAPVEHYLTFKKESDKAKYRGRNRIPMETFHEMYFAGEVDFNGDCLEVMEYRHDWASFRFTLSLYWFFLTGMMPEVIMHTRSQDEEQVRDHYDRGDDFYGWFLGPRMIYTSGIISDINKEETLEELQDNKLGIVCEKINLKAGERMLDIGCGWGTLAKFASANYGAQVTGVTLGRNQTAWGNAGLRRVGVPEEQSKILCMDYRDIPVPEGGWNKITCLEMAEHVGVRFFGTFLKQVHDMLDDDGVFFLQIAGLRKSWQFEDLIWGLFMNKYIFPGADASTPLGFFVDKLEGAGFEVKHIDTIGVHYSATIWRWYRNWMGNKEKVVAKSGNTSSPTALSSPAKVAPPATKSHLLRTSIPRIVSRVLTTSSTFPELTLLAKLQGRRLSLPTSKVMFTARDENELGRDLHGPNDDATQTAFVENNDRKKFEAIVTRRGRPAESWSCAYAARVMVHDRRFWSYTGTKDLKKESPAMVQDIIVLSMKMLSTKFPFHLDNVLRLLIALEDRATRPSLGHLCNAEVLKAREYLEPFAFKGAGSQSCPRSPPSCSTGTASVPLNYVTLTTIPTIFENASKHLRNSIS